MAKNPYKVGDRIRVIKEHPEFPTDYAIGDTATVTNLFNDSGVVVSWDQPRATPELEIRRVHLMWLAEIEPLDTVPAFIGEDHPRYEEWREEVTHGDTLLGLADWLEHQRDADDSSDDN